MILLDGVGYIRHILGKWTVSEVDVLKTGKMGKCKDLGHLNKGKSVMARWLSQIIYKTVGLVRCPQYEVEMQE